MKRRTQFAAIKIVLPQNERGNQRRRNEKIFPECLDGGSFVPLVACAELRGCYDLPFLCSGSDKNNFTRGCHDMQKSALLRNLNPRCRVDHQQAVQEEEQRKAMVAATQEAMTIQEGVVDKTLRAVYWLAKEEVATAKFSSLLHFLQFLGVDDLRHLSEEDPTRSSRGASELHILSCR